MTLNRAFTPSVYRSQQNLGLIDDVPFYDNEYEFLKESRTAEDYQKIVEWVNEELMPFMTRKSANERHSSYGLKHIAERELDFYVSNGDIKLILLEKGVPFKSYPGSPNVSYPLSQRFYRVKGKSR